MSRGEKRVRRKEKEHSGEEGGKGREKQGGDRERIDRGSEGN